MLGIEICHEDIKDDYRANVMPINSGVAISKIDQKLNMEPVNKKHEFNTRRFLWVPRRETV